MSPTLYFIRHGETDWNAEARLQGQRDIPLNGTGRRQAEEAGARLRGLAPGYEGLDYVTSPLGRARVTMELMQSALALPPQTYRVDERFKELSFGAWEGRTWREIRAGDADFASAPGGQKWTFVPPDGESYAMLARRVGAALTEITQDAVIVSHACVARVLLNLLCKVEPHEATVADIWQGKVLVFEAGGYAWV